MTIDAILFQAVSFSYAGASGPLFSRLTAHCAPGWTGVVGANGAGKSTLLKLAAGDLQPQAGRVMRPERVLYCRQRTDRPPPDLDTLLQAASGNARSIRGRLGVGKDWLRRWASLSHGERKRAQLAVALWRQPLALAVDEPTNHLDLEAQAMIHAALCAYRGVGLLVSHDRRLLDDLCHQCLFLDPPEAVLRPGNYTQGAGQSQREQESALRRRRRAKQSVKRLRREAARRREAASGADRQRSKRGLAAKDHDAKSRINLARLSGKDGAAGRRLNQLGGRLAQAQKQLDGLRVRKTHALGISMAAELSRRDTLFHLPAGCLALGGGRCLHYPALSMRPDDRIALTGPNGCGKSTLVAHLVGALDLAAERITYLPQEIDRRRSQDLLIQARALSGERLGRMMTVVSRLGSRPERLLESRSPSPGEVRKLLLAMGIMRSPHLILMDEPTNHLDLPSIECLEAVLAACACGLLLVSHDRRFLDTVTTFGWQIAAAGQRRGDWLLAVE